MNAASERGPEAGRARFVTACQQLLVLAVVATVLTPAARTVSLDIEPAGPLGSPASGPALQQAGDSSELPTGKVEASVEEHPLTAPRGVRGRASLRSTVNQTNHGQQVDSQPLPAEGYATVGLTWDKAATVSDEDISFQVRTRKGGTWSEWTDIPYHDEHAPDPDSPEGANARPGTEPMLVGDVDQVQVRADAKGKVPADLKAAVIDPGKELQTSQQRPSIDTSRTAATTESEGDEAGLELAAAATTPKPAIYSRRQWGANEEMRDPGSLRYFEVHAGFVHHTVNANYYSRADVDNIIRGIYAYHTRSRGWSDIGYNFLVDRFGRIWEGRYGGVRRPVVGAHTRGYNTHSFAMSAIGNFDRATPTNAMLAAYGRLFAWKLALHGIGANWRRRVVAGDVFQAINGHRDAGSTACPGRYLYNRLGGIRYRATNAQQGFGGRELQHNYARGPAPDLVMRRNSDGRGVVLTLHRRDGKFWVGAPIDTGLDLSDAWNLIKAGDWDRDGRNDVLVRRTNGRIYLHRGWGNGRFGRAILLGAGWGKVRQIGAVGDFDGDGFPDLVGRLPWSGTVYLWRGRGARGFAGRWPLHSWAPGHAVAIGRWDRDGAPDVFYRTRDALYAYYGNGPGGYRMRRNVRVNIARWNTFVGVGNYAVGPHSDVIARERGTNQLFFIPAWYSGGGAFGSPIRLGKTLQGYSMIS